MTQPELRDDGAFEALMATRLDLLTGGDWDAYYPAMAHWLHASSSDSAIRLRAVERLCMAVFWAERQSVAEARRNGLTLSFDSQERVRWLIAQLELAHRDHDDAIPAFLQQLRYTSLDDGNRDIVQRWLLTLSESPPSGVRSDVVDGSLVLIAQFDEDHADEVARLFALLDSPSNYVRACAARKLSGIDCEHLSASAAFSRILDKEIQRPGIAGPFWSEWQFMTESVPVNAIDWMLEILDRRVGAEPADMPFNGIDFHLHEICSGSPDAVRHMLDGGHYELAIETATEVRGVVPGMESVLRELAEREDYLVYYRAQVHLALYYGVIHPAGAHGSIRRWQNWSPECDVVAFYWGQDKEVLSVLVLYPVGGREHFDDALAWSLTNRLLPAELRGALVHSRMMGFEEGPPEPFVMPHQTIFDFTSGARVTLDGDSLEKRWLRIEISGGRLGKRWTPR
jgi:hypothetical protein